MISASRGAAAPSRHRCDSCPGEEAAAGFFSDFGPIRTASRPRCPAQASEGARRMRTAAEELEDCEKRLKELEPEQARLERRQRHVEKARLCEQRLAWVKFEEKRELALAAKEAKKTAVEKVKEADEAAQPLREERDRAERARQQTKQKYDAKQRQTADAFAHLERDKKDLEKRLEDLESEKDSSKNAEQRAAKAKAHAVKLRKAADTAQRALEALGTVDVIGLKRRVNALKPALVEAQTASRRAQDAAQDARDALTPLQRDLKSAKQALQKVSTVKLRQQTFERAHGRAGSEAVRLRQWLDQNSGRFRKPVLGPVALETDVEDDGARCALEHAVGSWIWTSFVQCGVRITYAIDAMCLRRIDGVEGSQPRRACRDAVDAASESRRVARESRGGIETYLTGLPVQDGLRFTIRLHKQQQWVQNHKPPERRDPQGQGQVFI
jgi:chemotaxis protein histidine kinase CheA